MTMSLSSGRRDRRSRKPPAIVEMALRKLEQRILDGGAPGSARKMDRSSPSLSLDGVFSKNAANSSTWDRPK